MASSAIHQRLLLGGGLYFDSIMLYLSPSRLNILGFLVKSKKVSFHTTLSFLFRVYWVK